jgi:hypothetical protein
MRITALSPSAAPGRSVLDASGEPAELDPYLGTPAHTIVARDDASVFVHLQGSGSFAAAVDASVSDSVSP